MKPRVIPVERQLTAVVRASAPFARLPEVQRTSRATLAAMLPSLDIGAQGRACTRWAPPVAGALPMEIGAIVEKPFTARGEVVPSELPAGRAVFLEMKGPFAQLATAWPALFDWCKAEGLTPAGVNWEIYGATEDADLYALLA